MRPSLLAAAGACLLALSLATGGLGVTASDFTSSATSSGNTFTAAAAVNAPPTVSAAVAGKASGGATGAIRQGATYYVYANAADDSGVSSVKANVSSFDSGQTAVPLAAGTYIAGGVSYRFRSALLTANTTLGAGTKSFTITAYDSASKTGTLTSSVTVDNTAPAASAISTTNGPGGVAGQPGPGDTLTLAYSESVENDSILDGWDGTATGVQVLVADGNAHNSDTVQVFAADATPANPVTLPLGIVDLSRSDVVDGGYVVFGASGGGTPSTMVRSGNAVVITLGTPVGLGGTVGTAASFATERWTPNAAVTDLAGNATVTSTITASGPSHKPF